MAVFATQDSTRTSESGARSKSAQTNGLRMDATGEVAAHGGTAVFLLGAMWGMLKVFFGRELARIDEKFVDVKTDMKAEYAAVSKTLDKINEHIAIRDQEISEHRLEDERRFSRLEGAALERDQLTPPHGVTRYRGSGPK